MALGPGKYDDLCSLVRRKSMARFTAVIVLDGKRGSGFSCQMASASMHETIESTKLLAHNLRLMADQIEEDANRMRSMTEEEAKRATHAAPDPHIEHDD